jgi:adenylate cyclase
VRLERLADHPWLVGDRDAPGAAVGRRVRWTTAVAIALANLIGAAVVIVFVVLVLPKPEIEDAGAALALNLAVAAGYLLIAVPIGVAWGRRRIERGRHGTAAWLAADRTPTPAQRRRLLRAPVRIMTVEVVLWGLAAASHAAVPWRPRSIRRRPHATPIGTAISR